LRDCAIGYRFLGRQLGGRPAERQLYDQEGRVDYDRVRRTAAFGQGMDLLCQAAKEHTVAILCSEADPLDCHRGLMIAPALVDRGILPDHLHGDGSIESTSEFEARLMRESGVGAGMLDGLFAAMISNEERAEWLTEAYRCQTRRKAFWLRPDAEVEDSPG
jgi:hypothetical protein